MAQDLGSAVSYVYDDEGYDYDLVVFEKKKPILDSEVNLVQQLQNQINRRQMTTLPSGWISLYPIHTDKALANKFYTQDPSSPKPEYALVNGQVVYVTNTGTTTDNLNIVNLGDPPTTGNLVNGVFLEVWRALLDPNTDTNKPDPANIIDSLYGIMMFDSNNGWICGQNGLILNTQNGGRTWTVQLVDTTRDLHGVSFVTSSIGWVVGNNGVISRTSSAGATWVTLTSPTSENLKSVYAYSQLIAWAVGDSGTILRTTNGVTWIAMVSGTTSNLTKVHFYDALVGWAVGDSGTILKTTNGGITWIQMASGSTTNLNSIFFYDLNFGFAVGDGGTILRSSDGGASWVSQSGNVYDGGYTSVSENLNDVTMVPSLDVLVVDEEVSSQANGTNLTFVLSHTPVTEGDGKGTTTIDPSKVTVKVNGVAVAVDTLDGAAGRFRLVTAPMTCDVVKVTYYYKQNSAMFSGRAWIVGDNGRILRTDNIGATWDKKNPSTSYDIYSGSFIDQSKGWIAGENSIIWNTENGGDTWTTQQSEIVAREVQRVYKEGNIGTSVFLNENTIHPDAAVETTKRVQLQYKIRVVRSVDPDSNPEAGLSSAIYGEGPGTGQYPYQNMGSTTGDYGLWRAKCLNTVDGYVYAIPMFFINRRNIQAFNAQSNANGQHVAGTFVRPDLLTATMVVDGDILDVRRKVVIPSVSELFESGFDLLSKTELATAYGHLSSGGDQYGKELLQIDRVSGLPADGGTQISGTLTDAANGLISSEVSILTRTDTTTASTVVPTELSLPLVSGFYHQNSAQYTATYVCGASSIFNGMPIPGYWSDIGSSQPKFVFSTSANSQLTDPLLTDYLVTGPEIKDSTSSLTHIPSTPMLVKNTSGAGSSAFFYQGVLGTENKTIEQWDSGVSGYQSYATAYPGTDSSNTNQLYRASSVELHYLTRATYTSGGPVQIDSSNVLAIDFSIPGADSSDLSKWVIGLGTYAASISKINNITSGFSYKIDHITVTTDKIRVYSVSGYPFIEGATLEIVAGVLSGVGDNNVRNGATVNFTSGNKKIDTFCKSEIFSSADILIPTTTVTIPISGGVALGMSATETSSNLTQYVCWKDPGTTMYPVQVSGFGTATLTLTFSTTVTGIFTVQVLVGQTSLLYDDDVANDGLQIAYTYLPYVGISSLPSTVSLDVVETPSNVYVSALGSGGSGGEPYSNPMEFIPTNNSTILNDGFFSNYDKLRFSSFSVGSGFVSMPAIIPKKFSDTITLSSLTVDNMNRPFYSACSEQFEISVEGLQMALPRKVYLPVLARVKDPSNTIFMTGEYVLVVFCRTFTTETENSVGYTSGNHDSIAVYRLPNRPMSRT